MLKVPEHQVAGHQARYGKVGPLVDDTGRFYKPLQSDERGSKEVAFYTSFSSDSRVPDNIRKFFPVFHGTQLLEVSGGSGLYPHLVLQDVVSGLVNPSVMDIKIGSRTWYPEASEEYIQKCIKKDRESTTVPLGFRISGWQIHHESLGYQKPDKRTVKGLKKEDVRLVLRRFVSSDLDPPDCSHASVVYGGSAGILAQLLELKSWFEDQTMFHFYSCSILMLYEKQLTVEKKTSRSQVKLVDFAHVVEGKGVIDHSFLGGLCSLIKFISEILTCPCPDEHAGKACLQDSETNWQDS